MASLTESDMRALLLKVGLNPLPANALELSSGEIVYVRYSETPAGSSENRPGSVWPSVVMPTSGSAAAACARSSV